MNARIFLIHKTIPVLIIAIAGLWVAGCKSTPKIDWDSRIGHYTYDQAVTEFGPPDRSTPLTDGRTVADWIRHSGGGFSFGLGTGFSSGSSAVGVGQSVGTGYGDKVLRLTFGADHKLESWSKSP